MRNAFRSLQEHYYHPPAKLFRYEVEQLDSGDSDVSEIMIVEASQVRRRKQHYSRDRNKIFLRQLCEQNDSGIWVVKVRTDFIFKCVTNSNRFRIRIYIRR